MVDGWGTFSGEDWLVGGLSIYPSGQARTPSCKRSEIGRGGGAGRLVALGGWGDSYGTRGNVFFEIGKLYLLMD